MGDDKTFVTKDFCDERLARVMAEQKNNITTIRTEIQNQLSDVKTEIHSLGKRMNNFGEEIAEHATNACNGEIIVKHSPKEKYVLYGTAITAVGLVIVELIKLVSTLIA